MTSTSADPTPVEADPRRWKALVVIAIAQLMIVLDASIVNMALPSIQADLGISDADRQWAVTAYTLAFVTLDEGVTMMTNLVDCEPAAVSIGQRVRVVFKPSDGGHAVAMFTPIDGGSDGHA